MSTVQSCHFLLALLSRQDGLALRRYRVKGVLILRGNFLKGSREDNFPYSSIPILEKGFSVKVTSREVESLINQGFRRSARQYRGVLASQKMTSWEVFRLWDIILAISFSGEMIEPWLGDLHPSLNSSFSLLSRLCQGPWRHAQGAEPTLSQPLTCQHGCASELVRIQLSSPHQGGVTFSIFRLHHHCTHPSLASYINVPKKSINYNLLSSE